MQSRREAPWMASGQLPLRVGFIFIFFSPLNYIAS